MNDQVKVLCCLLGLLIGLKITSFAQPIPIGDYWNRELERVEHYKGKPAFTTYKPQLKSTVNFQKITGEVKDSVKYYSMLSRLVFRDHLIQLKNSQYTITIDPLLQLEVYQDLKNETYNNIRGKLYNNGRGAIVQGRIGNGVEFQTIFLENQSVLPYYQSIWADSTGVIPGMGRHKVFKKYGYDYGISTSSLYIGSKSWWNLGLMYGKQFFGNGYRSLVLSDASMNMPLLQLGLHNQHFQYKTTAGIGQEQSRIPLGSTGESLFKRKLITWNYLSYLPTEHLEIALLETVVSQRWTPQGVVAPALHAYIPVLGARGWMAQKDTNATVMYGANLKWNANRNTTFYGQYGWVMKGMGKNAIQFGALFTDIGMKNLDLRVEYNQVGEYFYAQDINLMSLTQQNQSLGHASGSALTEWLIRGHYRWKRLLAQGCYHVIQQELGNASNPYATSYGSKQGSRDFQYFQGEIGYLVQPHTHLCVWLGITQVDELKVYNSNYKINTTGQIVTFKITSDICYRAFDF
ncbi:MAG: hypothetical protein RLY35_1405 [Bacteroidota bacterium]